MTFFEGLNFRHACKIFDENKQISEPEFEQIIDAGILAPSSMGMQPWEFELITDSNLREEIKAACWGQKQITTASKLLIIYAKIADLKPGSAYTQKIINARTDKSEEAKAAYANVYKSMLEANEGLDDDAIFAWTRAQCYIAAQTMMMAAACLGVDSCPIEGFDRNKIAQVLGTDKAQKRVALVLPFGYRVNSQPEKLRNAKSEVFKVR